MKKRLDLVLLAVLASSACAQPGTRAPGRAAATPPVIAPAAAPDRAVRGREATALAPERVAACAGFPSPLVAVAGKESCQYLPKTGAEDVDACVSFAAASSPRLTLLTILIYRGRSQFFEQLGLPGDLPGWAGPHFEPVAPGRRASIAALGLGLGGAITWGTLPSPRATFDLTLVVEWLAHDYPVTKLDREALRDVDMTRALACLDAALWP